MNCTEVLKRLISIDSNVNSSNKRIIYELQKMLSKYESKIYSFKKGKLDLFNLIVKIPGESHNKPVIFAMHTDTVAVNSKWKLNPFRPIVKSGKMFGLGSCDMKGGMAAAISAALEIGKPEQDVYLIFDADEEETGYGVKNVVKNFKAKQAKIIVTEPSDLKVITEQKAALGIKVEFKGLSIHASRTNYKNNLKNNAIYKASSFIEKMKKYDAKISGSGQTVCITKINGGSSINAVPDNCIMTVDTRVPASISLSKVEKEIRKIAGRDAKFTLCFSGKSFKTQPNSQFVKRLIKLSNGLVKGTQMIPAWTEAAYYQKYGEVVILGPGSIKQAHVADEFVKVRELEGFKKLYKRIMLD